MSRMGLTVAAAAGACRVTELAKRFCLDLADTLTRNEKRFADFLQRPLAPVEKTEAHADDSAFPFRKC